MNSAQSAYGNTNRLIRDSADLITIATSPDLRDKLKDLAFDWDSGSFNPDAEIATALKAHGFIEASEAGHRIGRLGQLFLGRLSLLLDPERLDDAELGSLREKYSDFKLISSGKNSIVLKARHRLLGSDYVLKLVRPGASEDIL